MKTLEKQRVQDVLEVMNQFKGKLLSYPNASVQANSGFSRLTSWQQSLADMGTS